MTNTLVHKYNLLYLEGDITLMTTNSLNTKETLWTKDFIFLSCSNACLFSGFHILIPTLPMFIAGFGGTDAQIGLIMGSFTFSAILIRLFTARGVNKLGKKNFLVAGILISLLATAFYYWATTVTLSLSVRILHGFGFGIATTMYATIVSDIIPSSRRGEGMGYFGLGTTVMMALAPALGVWVADFYGFSVLFSIAVASQIAAFIWTKVFPVRIVETAAIDESSFWTRLFERKAVFPAFLSLLLGICVGGVLSFITLRAKELHIINAGYFFLVATSFVFLARLFVGRIFDTKGPAWVILPGAVILLLSLAMLSELSSAKTFLIAAACYGLGTGTLFPSLQTWMVNLVTPERRGIANATFYNSLDTGVGGGAILLGLVAEKSGYASIYFISAAVIACFITVYMLYLVKEPIAKFIESPNQD